MRHGRALLAGALALAAAAGLAGVAAVRDADKSGAATPPTEAAVAEERYTVRRASGAVPAGLAAGASYVLGDRLHRLGAPTPERLSRPLLGSLLGPGAVPSRDGRYLAYHAAERGVPLLVLRDLRTGEERVLARNARTVAWGPEGQLAYVRTERGALGRVVVHATADAPAAVWTGRADAYEARAWAGPRLLVAVRRCLTCPQGREPGLYALTGPGTPERLPLADLAALSPDARWAVGPYDEVAGQDSPTPYVRLVELETGRVAHTLDLPAALRGAGSDIEPAAARLSAAAWRGDEIVATTAAAASLVFLRVVEERLEPTEVLRVAPDAFSGALETSFARPSFAGARTDRVAVPVSWEAGAPDEPSAAVLVCDRVARSCEAGRALPASRSFALVESPSRP